MRRGCLPLIALLLAAAGCGETSSGDTGSSVRAAVPAKNDRALIRRAVKSAIHEGTDGTARKTCDYITPEGQVFAISGYSFRYKKALKSCAEMVRFARKVEAEYLSDARHSTVRRIKLHGTRADVTVEGPRQKLPGDKRGYGGLEGLQLRKLGNRWKIDSATFVPAPGSTGE